MRAILPSMKTFDPAFVRRLLALVLAGFVLSACAETQFLMHTAKRLKSADDQSGYKIGEPYQIDGVWYYPSEDWTYDRSGIASWYGPQFHGKNTANGELFDQWKVSAAHKTLPLPSIVRVTNLENGRALTVRVNDRGPFARGRVIDVSQRAAQLLGFEGKGTARVRVQIMASESRALAESLKSGRTLAADEMPVTPNVDLAQTPVASQPLGPPTATPAQAGAAIETASLGPVALPEPVTPPPPARVDDAAAALGATEALPGGLYIQAGAFSDITNAERAQARLGALGSVVISPVMRASGDELYRVRLGPIADGATADRLLVEVAQAGYPRAITVTVKTALD